MPLLTGSRLNVRHLIMGTALFNKEYEHLVRLPKKKGGCFGGKKKVHAGLYVAADGTPL